MRRKLSRRVKDILSVTYSPFLRSIGFVCRVLPRRASLWMGRRIGDLSYLLARSHRTIAWENLTMVYGGEKSSAEIKRIMLQTSRNLGMSAVEFLRIPKLDGETCRRLVEDVGRHHVDDALARGKGIIFLAAHFGNWELMAAYGSLTGMHLSAIARTMDYPKVDRLINGIRGSAGINVIPTKRSGYRVVSRLRRNEIVGILADQNARRDLVFVDFFGRNAATTIAPALYALRTGAAVIPVFMVRLGGGRHKLIFEDPVTVVNTGDLNADIQTNTARFVKILESYVREYPDHWVWMHRRWKTRPEKVQARKAMAKRWERETILRRDGP